MTKQEDRDECSSDFYMLLSNREALQQGSPLSSSGFTVPLPQQCKLKGNWSVALTNVSYTPGQYTSTYEDKNHWKISVQSPYKSLNKAYAVTDILYTIELDRVELARCKKVKTLIELIQQTLKKCLCKGDEELAKKIFSMAPYTTTPISLNGKEEGEPKTMYTIVVADGFTVYLSRMLADILHCKMYGDLVDARSNHRSSPEATVTITPQSIFDIPPYVLESDLSLVFQQGKTQKTVSEIMVLCDIVKESLMPGVPKMKPVLAHFPASSDSSPRHLEPRNLLYKKVIKSEFSSIRFGFVGDEDQANVVQPKERIAVELHFKPINKSVAVRRFKPY